MPTAQNGSVSLAYEVHEATRTASPPLGALLLIPGIFNSLALWDAAFVAALADLGFRVITFDPRGAGMSSHPAGPYTLEEMAADCAAVLDAAGEPQASVLGHSMGGIIGMRLALDHPGRVTSLVVLSAAAGSKHVKPAPKMVGYMLALQALALADSITAPVSSYASSWVRYAQSGVWSRFGIYCCTSSKFAPELDSVGEQIAQHFERTKGHPLLSSGQIAAADVDILEPIRAIACPTAVVAGTEDCFYPKATIEAVHDAIRDSEMVWLEGYNHQFPTDVWLQIADITARTARRAHG
ncbi:Alpha/Beta hydrolase protein [Hyaloraphidium curvatum]|nr:Alpha/Beta hydrolase protein [Hyaloraphidium curvatum]